MASKSRRAMSLIRHKRLRKYVEGTSSRPRLAVFRSTKHIYAQLIDDSKGITLAAASSQSKQIVAESTDKKPIELAPLVGKKIAELAKEAGVTQVVFDRGGFRYHGRVKVLAESAREAGLEF